MKIVSLIAENIKKLVAVEIRPDGNLVQITGANGQGKSSVLDSLWWALSGTKNIQASPIRKGQESARIRLDLGEIIVTRTFRQQENGDYTTGIVVENADGARFSSPQSLLDSLLGELTFDPLAFARMDSKARFQTLRKFVPDVDFDALDQQDRQDFAKRTDLNRRHKEAALMASQIQIDADAPTVRIDESALVDELEKAAKLNAEIEGRKLRREQAEQQVRKLAADADLANIKRDQECERLKRECKARIKGVIDRTDKETFGMVTQSDALIKLIASAEPLPPIVDVSALRQKIADARSNNEKVTLVEGRNTYLKSAEERKVEADALTAAMEIRAQDKRSKIAAAKLPVSEITFGDGDVLLCGVPFNQASDAEQLRASIAFAMAVNPKLRVIRVRDGSLLDQNSLKLIEEMAKDKDYQVWVESVRSDGKIGFVMEDGHARVAAHQEATGG